MSRRVVRAVSVSHADGVQFETMAASTVGDLVEGMAGAFGELMEQQGRAGQRDVLRCVVGAAVIAARSAGLLPGDVDRVVSDGMRLGSEAVRLPSPPSKGGEA